MDKKRKIGLITLPLTNYNYGGVLQAYALHQYLEKAGFHITHLNRQYNTSPLILFKMKIARLLNYKISGKEKLNNSHFVRFMSSRLNISKPFYDKKKMEKFIDQSNIEVLVTGSDQVWRQDYALNIYSDLYLDFELKNNPTRLSYAASFGKDELSLDLERTQIQSFLNKFKGISVRETAGIEICKSMGIDDVSYNIDPTLLLNSEDYMKLIKKSNTPVISAESKLVSYLLDDSKKTTDFLNKIALDNNLTRQIVGKKTDVKNAVKNKSTIKPKDSIEQWLNSFASAELIITDSFHGCVFSILFNKQFITIGNIDRGLSRFQTLLKLFNLEDRLVLDYDLDKIQSLIESEIDYEKVNAIINTEREKSKAYFEKSLN